jgi:2,5-furandicarboxylate decarboxylase 1
LTLRGFIEELQTKCELTKITKPVSVEYEMAGIIAANGEKPIFFENIKESSVPVVAGLVSSKELICRSMGITKEQLLPKMLDAIEHPVAPNIVTEAPCQEVVELGADVDLTKLPIMRYTNQDGGRYIASAVSIVKDPQTGNRNMCFHRLMLKDKNHFIARIVEHRGTDTVLAKAGGELDIAICLGNSTATLLAAATTMPMGVDELGMANALERTDLVKCKTVDIEVPADAEFVFEGRITKEKATEGPSLT